MFLVLFYSWSDTQTEGFLAMNSPRSKFDPMYQWACDMWQFPRSITGRGLRQTISYLEHLIPGLERHSVPSGTKAFDWTVPDEWNVDDAYIMDSKGCRVIDWNENNLHVVGYSHPIDEIVDRWELEARYLNSLPDKPDAIPYITSYYKKRSGFCMSHNQRLALKDDTYRVVIDSTLEPGFLNYADIIIPGESEKEVLLATYICHPQMANNELSGPVVVAALARWLQSAPRRYTYRIVFVPETIGAIVYLSRNLDIMKRNTIAGFQVTCVGDDRDWSFMPSRRGSTLSDRTAENILGNRHGLYSHYDFLERGADERQWCAPGVDLPVCSIMRSKYGTYPEYHTSLDDLSFINQKALEESFDLYRDCVKAIEGNYIYKTKITCEPFLRNHDLIFDTQSEYEDKIKKIMDFWAYCDGNYDLITIADIIGVDASECVDIAKMLEEKGIIAKYKRNQYDVKTVPL